MKWHSRKFSIANTRIPSACGLYAIGYLSEVDGLVTGIDIIYIGQAINLKRRLTQHSPWVEVNPGLEEFLRRNRSRIRVWYTTDVSRQFLGEKEKELIRAVDPRFNRLKYRKKDKE